jgi:hypothetical protein
MEDVNPSIIGFGPMRFAFDLNLPDEPGNGLDGIRHGEKSQERQARVRQVSMNPRANGSD